LILYTDGTPQFRAIAASYSSGSFTPGSAISIDTITAVAECVSQNDTQAFVFYQNTSSNAQVAVILSVSGTTLTENSGLSVGTGTGIQDYVGVAKLGSNTFVVGYVDSSRTHAITLLEVTGTTITQLGSTFTFPAVTNENAVVPIYHSPTRVLVMQVDSANYISSTVDLTTNHSTWAGVAVADAAADANCTFITHGTSDDVSGLTIATFYYTDIDGGYSTISTGTKVGFALSDTSIIVRS